MIKVVAALIKQNGKYLIAKRSTGDPQVLGKWEFPGGKVKLDESEKQAIEREIYEEFELKIKAEKYLINSIYKYPSKAIDLRLYYCKYISGKLNLHEHSKYKWVKPDELLKYDFAPADVPLIKYVKEGSNEYIKTNSA